MYLYILRVVLILENSADPDEMQQYAEFHLGLHCSLKYQFRVSSIQRVKTCTLRFFAGVTIPCTYI